MTHGPAVATATPPARLRPGFVYHNRTVCWTSQPAPPAANIPPMAQPDHGRIVTCPVCGDVGLCPEEGHELDYLPPGTRYDPRRGRFTLRLEY